ncbi:MAG: SDR family NAD(P)-dependent oxidoreductase [Phascolarctobacterium faecium]
MHYVQGDVKDLEACRSAAQNVREQRENIDLIVNAAGIYQERRLEK